MVIIGNQISHASHRHKLKLEETAAPFKCDGCKLEGIGKHYRCASCDFDLHEHCGVEPGTHISHPLFPKCENLQFCLQPPKDARHICDACQKTVTGFLYRCNQCNFDLHPCCAKLPMMIKDGEVRLELIEKKGRWIYMSKCKNYKLDVACARELLEESSSELLGSKMTGRPKIRSMVQTNHYKKSKGRVMKCCEMAGLALKKGSLCNSYIQIRNELLGSVSFNPVIIKDDEQRLHSRHNKPNNSSFGDS